MTIGEYIKYLQQFKEDAKMSFIVINPSREARITYPVKTLSCITDLGIPVVCLEVGNSKPIDEQMDIFEFMEEQP